MKKDSILEMKILLKLKMKQKIISQNLHDMCT